MEWGGACGRADLSAKTLKRQEIIPFERMTTSKYGIGDLWERGNIIKGIGSHFPEGTKKKTKAKAAVGYEQFRNDEKGGREKRRLI